MIKKISLIFLITIILILFSNILVALIWPIISDIRNNKHSYNKQQINLLNLSDKDLVILQNETWRNNYKYIYVPFIGHSEIDKKGKFVNFSQKDGRKIIRPKNCEENIYLYGGSTTFGYNVTDNQTIGYFLQKKLPKNYCVYNHGRAQFYSKQENNLFLIHLENKRKIDYAIFLDGVNERCGGHSLDKTISHYFSLMSEKPYNLWKKNLIRFLYSIPMIQLYYKFSNNSWEDNENFDYKVIETCQNKIPLNNLLDKRVKYRHKICETFMVKCFSFLQPMAGTHGIQHPSLISEKQKKSMSKKYKILEKSLVNNYIINLGYVLQNDENLSYIDAVHYSPETNKKIAIELLKYIFKV